MILAIFDIPNIWQIAFGVAYGILRRTAVLTLPCGQKCPVTIGKYINNF